MPRLRLPGLLLGGTVLAALLAGGCGLASLPQTAGLDGGPGYDGVGGADADDEGATITPDAGRPAVQGLCHDDVTCKPDLPGCLLAADAGVDAAGSTADAGATTACGVVLGDASTAAPVCRPAGQNHDGEPCTSGADCAGGYECVGSPGRCRHYCCESTACAALDNLNYKKYFCDVASEAAAPNVKVPVCQVVQPCTLLAGGCDLGFTCALVDINDGTTSCVATGPVKVGQDCQSEHCGPNLSCIGDGQGTPTCQQICDNYHKCPGTQLCKAYWPSLKQLNVGICQ